MNRNQAIKILKDGGVGVMPTDTIYGLVGQALNPITVARIYKLKHRPLNKPSIILIGDLADLKKFKFKPTPATLKIIKQIWPGPISIIFTKTLTCRLPALSPLRKLLKQTGPLIATSVNSADRPPAKNIIEAKKYFGKQVDFYFGKKRLTGKPSTLIKIRNNQILVLRG
ncbi:MAG: L-threonylcarbamoyladenylate synthase [Candidatus Vogelbacteria bacterium]